MATPTLARSLTVLLFVILAAGCGRGGKESGVPEEVVQRNNVGTSLLGQQKWGEAAAEFRKGLEIHRGDPLLLNNVAVALLQQGNSDDAEGLLREALAADPDHPYAHYNLGLIERNRGNFEAAAKHFESVAAFDPQEVFTLYNLGATLSRIDRLDEAEQTLRRALESNPIHVSSLYALGRLLVQRGRQDEGVALINRSQEIRARSGLDEAVGNQYGEQGPFAMGAEYPGGGLQAPAPVAVMFKAEHTSGGGMIPGAFAWTTFDRAPDGPAVLLYASDHVGQASLAAEQIAVAGGPGVLAMAAGDIDGDGVADVAALVNDGSVRVIQRGDGGALAWRADPLFSLPDPTKLPSSSDLALVDRDHDGDLDIFLCWAFDPIPMGWKVPEKPAATPPGCLLATNDSSGGFKVETDDTGVAIAPGRAMPVSVAFSDVDNDRDVDLLAATLDGIQLFSNDRDGTFTDVSAARGLADVRGAGSLELADLDKDGWMDLVVGTVEGPKLLRNRRGSFDAPLALDPPSSSGSTEGGPPWPRRRAVVLDFDNDGFLDIAATSAGGPFALYRNLGAGNWGRVAEPLESAFSFVPLAPLDADGDGDLDLAVLGPAGFEVLTNHGGNANGWIEVRPRGVGDNHHGVGAKVEVLAGALRQKFEVVNTLPVHAGLGHRESADTVRLLWPGGVLQDELDRETGAIHEVAQLDRKGTSCPLLYAWRDGRWRFVTDFLGGCAIGYRHGPDALSVPDTDEYVKVEGGLSERDGRLRLRLNNQLEEVIWFDQAELIVVDHPEGTEIFPNERLMPGPPWPAFRVFASDDIRPLAAALDPDSGRDLAPSLRERDRGYVEGFELLPFKGYARLHRIELDLGELLAKRRVLLLLDGWIDYADSSANIAAAQAGVALVPPRLSVADGNGGWRRVEGLMGFPAGLPKTMAVDLTGHVSPAHPRIRIETNMRIYWDRARVMLGGERTPLEIKRLAPQAAELRFGGYPVETSPDGRKPFGYDPERVLPTSTWKAHIGAYTPFGDVAGLLRRIDDRLVTTRHGDEIELTFASPGPPAEGRTRSYLLYADGFGKDMDPNSAASSRVGPVPFHGMPVYPYGDQVAPAAAEGGSGRAPRLVLPDPGGLPGALPLALAGNGEPR